MFAQFGYPPVLVLILNVQRLSLPVAAFPTVFRTSRFRAALPRIANGVLLIFALASLAQTPNSPLFAYQRREGLVVEAQVGPEMLQRLEDTR
jgi:hypothetical protein